VSRRPVDALVTRRVAFQGFGALGVAFALAACGGGDDDGGGSGGGAAPEAGAGLAAVSEVPVGGGIVIGDQNIVLVQPTEGEFKAYSAACTHQGTTVNAPTDQGIICPNHGSIFSIEDGSVVQGPATEPLPEVAVKVEGDQVVAA
jgi:Rieske Fe-S protein